MNHNPEEQALHSDAHQFKLQKQHWNPADATFAIQRGMSRARNQTRKSGPWMRWSVALLAGAFAIGWFVTGMRGVSFPNSSSMTTEVVQSWGVLEPYRALAGNDDGNTLASALRNNYFQTLSVSATEGDYKIRLDAVTADENKMILLFSARLDGGRELYDVSSVQLLDADTGRHLGNSTRMGRGDDQGKNLWSKYTVDLDRNQPLPKRVSAEIQLSSVGAGKLDDPSTWKRKSEFQYSKKIKLMFTLDPKFSQYKTRIVEPESSVILDGHEVVLSKVEISPLQIRAHFVYEPGRNVDYSTRLAITDLYMPKDIVASFGDGHETSLLETGGYGSENGEVYNFESNMLDEPQSLDLRIYTSGSGKAAQSGAEQREIHTFVIE